MQTRDSFYIDGRWMAPATSEVIEVVSPHSEEVIARVPAASPADIDNAVSAARRAFDTTDWPMLPAGERIAALRRFADLYGKRLNEMADIISAEMGSPRSYARRAQSPGPLALLTSTLTVAETYPWEEHRVGMRGDVLIRREAIGVVGAITPWNGPQATAIGKMAPALVAGNTVVLKPPPEAPLDSYLLAELCEEAGLPHGVINIVAGGREAGEYLVNHPGVDKITFTGSTAAGRAIGRACGEQLKRCTLELGGKSAAIILDDADLESTMAGLKAASLANGGQVCVSQSRILASRSRYAEIVDALGDTVSSMAVGDPADLATEIGPLAARRQQERVNGYIELGVQEGARQVVGGSSRPDGLDTGWYVRPTVFADVSNDMRIAREEIFGPVLAVIPYDDVDDAIKIANDSEYGLAGSVWTADPEAGMAVARRVRTGSYAVNKYTVDYMAPFGGYKSSGIGREWGKEGLDLFVEMKSIVP